MFLSLKKDEHFRKQTLHRLRHLYRDATTHARPKTVRAGSHLHSVNHRIVAVDGKIRKLLALSQYFRCKDKKKRPKYKTNR